MQRVLSAVGIVALAITGSAYAADTCVPQHKFETITPGKLTVVTMIIPPFSIPKDGQLGGVDGDVISKIAKMECLTLNPVVADSKAVLQYVVSNQADVAVGNWFRTASRAKAVGMTDPVYLDSLGIFSKEGTETLAELAANGKQVGSVQGYNWVSDLQTMFGTKLKLYPSPVTLAQDLEAGRIDAGLDSYSVGVYAQQQGGLKGFKVVHAKPDEHVRASIEPAQISFMFDKSKESMGKALNENIATLQANGDIKEALTNYGLSAQDANVGKPRLIE